MPWKESSVMEERLRFVARLLDGEAMTDVCREFGISHKTGYPGARGPTFMTQERSSTQLKRPHHKTPRRRSPPEAIQCARDQHLTPFGSADPR
jgi:transposase-like protein